MYSTMARYYDELFPVSSESIDFITSFLNIGPSVNDSAVHCSGPISFPTLTAEHREQISILDAGCASGRLSIELAERGIYVEGIDLDEMMIRIANERSEEKDLTCLTHFQVGDLTELSSVFPEQSFELTFSFGNTLPHLLRAEDRGRCIDGMYSLLKEGGVCIIQLLNYQKILKNRPSSLPTISAGTVDLTRNYCYSGKDRGIEFISCLTNRATGERHSSSVRLYPLTCPELLDELKHGGFTHIGLYQNYRKEAFRADTSDVLLCVAKKAS